MLLRSAKYLVNNWVCLLGIFFSCTSIAAPAFKEVEIGNHLLTAKVTPDLGGRLVYFGLVGHDNVIKLGQPYLQGIQPEVSATANNIGYLGHIVWLSPQSQWWQQQQINIQRKENNATWPPDPYVIFGENQVIHQSATGLSLQGAKSPVSNIRLDKQFELKNDHLLLSAAAQNIGAKTVSWGLWFNTRISGDATVLLPAQKTSFVKEEFYSDHKALPLTQHKGIAIVNGRRAVELTKSKLWLEPTGHWVAAAIDGQLLVINFPKVEPETIHPEQSPVELYFSLDQSSQDNNLIELEMHSAYARIQPKQTIEFQTKWYVYPYPAQWTQEQLIEFTLLKVNML